MLEPGVFERGDVEVRIPKVIVHDGMVELFGVTAKVAGRPVRLDHHRQFVNSPAADAIIGDIVECAAKVAAGIRVER